MHHQGRKSVIINTPATDPERVGIPEGYPPLSAFRGVPLKQGGKTIGMIGLGNKPGGYDQSDQAAAKALAPAMVEAFLRKRAEARIKELNQDLVLHVQQLEATNKELEAFSYSVSHDLRAPPARHRRLFSVVAGGIRAAAGFSLG